MERAAWRGQPMAARPMPSERACQDSGTADSCSRWALIPGEGFPLFSNKNTPAGSQAEHRENSVTACTGCLVQCLLLHLFLFNSEVSKTRAQISASPSDICRRLFLVRLAGSGSCMITWWSPWRGLRPVVALAVSWRTAWVSGKLCR